MEETLKISKEAPEEKSQNYQFLREEGIRYIQEIAGKIWSDYNLHDPGITILEALCYAITDLGYRVSSPMKDLLSVNRNDPANADIKNFITAGKILPNAPLTKNDYRKLIIDTEIEVIIPSTGKTEFVGVKNAWIDKSKNAEVSFYVYIDENTSHLSFTKNPPKSNQEAIEVGILYNILLEFDKSDNYGDLNENTINGELTIYSHPDDPAMEGLVIDVKVVCPRWDEDLDWDSLGDLVKSTDTKAIKLTFSGLPENYHVKSYQVTTPGKFEIEIYDTSEASENPIQGLDKIRLSIEDFIFNPEHGLLKAYQDKIGIIHEIIGQVKARLHADRNLCEDFYKISALKVEEIAVCSDVELEMDVDIEEVQAQIFHEISKFLSPAVNFYTIGEMLDRCKVVENYAIKSINRSGKIFTIDKNVTEKLGVDDVVTVEASTSNTGNYTVAAVNVNAYNPNYSDIAVLEDIPSDILTGGESVSATYTNEEDCYTIDTIFEGPLLKHGFIDNAELDSAGRRKAIHVSDLIQIMMNIRGVAAVKEIQVANIPQDNELTKIPSKNVIWCLDLAFEQNYVPRLSIDRSKLRFFKENIPFTANNEEVEDILQQLESKERDQKLRNPKLDIEVPRGEFRNMEDYTSIQEDFPLLYGIGYEGVPNLSRMSGESKTMRMAQASQMKGYLMFFDQLLANYLSQLANVKNLFSMNSDKDADGNFIIGRTYYTQPLFDIVPDADKLYINKTGHAMELNTIAEDEALFATRRNKFTDHLLARFSEQFSDYAVLIYRLFGNQSATDLIDKKLAFLNAYPELSSNRGRGFNYRHPQKTWHIENVTGLEKRVSLLMGIPQKGLDRLNFSKGFSIGQTAGGFEFVISEGSAGLLKNVQSYHSLANVNEILELIVVNGIYREKYRIRTDDHSNYYFQLFSDDVVLGTSVKNDYATGLNAQNDIDVLIGVLEEESGISDGWDHDNPESNRHNLAVPFYNYFKIGDHAVNSDGSGSFSYNLFSKAFGFNTADNALFGSFIVEPGSEDIEWAKQQHLWEVIANGIIKDRYAFGFCAIFSVVAIDQTKKIFTIDQAVVGKIPDNNTISIHGSEANDGEFTVASVSENTGNSAYSDVTVVENIPSGLLPGGEKMYTTYAGIEDDAIPGTDYLYNIYDRNGAKLATSVEKNFNQPLAENISSLNNLKVKIENSAGNNGYYPISSVVAKGPDIILASVEKEIAVESIDGKIQLVESFSYLADPAGKKITIGTDIAKKITGDCIITIFEPATSCNYYLSLRSYQLTGTGTVLVLNEELPVIEGESEIYLRKSYPYSLDERSKKFSIDYDGGWMPENGDRLIMWSGNECVGEYTIQSSEILGKRLSVMVEENITVDKRGMVTFTRLFPIINLKKNPVALPGVRSVFTIKGGEDKKAMLRSIGFLKKTFFSNEGFHVIEHSLLRPKNKQLQPGLMLNGTLAFTDPSASSTVNITIEKIGDSGSRIEAKDAKNMLLKQSDKFTITGSSGGVNDGEYYVDSVDANGITILCDQLMPVILQPRKDCPYQIENPYTCIASVVLPYWPERFNNGDFRKLFEQTLRLEAPAHIFLRICWVNPYHIQNLEKKYKKWIVENSRANRDEAKISRALSALIEALFQLRNVYPVGTLYDPEEHKTLENTIILNNTMIGNA